MGDGLGLYLKDLYPDRPGIDSGSNATPDVNDQDSLNEDTKIAEQASHEMSRKNFFIALVIVICAIILFGVGGGGK